MSTSLSRVTIVAPRAHLDVALPADVPLVDLLPTLLDLAGSGADETGRRDGWSLSRLDSGELDSSRTPAQLRVYDGEILYLRPRGEDFSVAVFDDVADALAEGAADRRGRWTPAHGRTAALGFGVAALSAGAVTLPFLGPPFGAAGLAGLGLAAGLLLVAVVFARALGQARMATAFAVLATVYALIGGLLFAAGPRRLTELTTAHVVVAATVAIVAAVLASVGVPAAAPLLLALAACVLAGLGAVGGAGWLDAGIAGSAAIVGVLAYATLPVLPMLAYRLAGLPRPTVPTGRESLRQVGDPVDGPRVVELGRRADAYLSAMLAALGAVSAAAAVAVSRSGVGGLVLAAVLGLLPILRSRWFGRLGHRIPLLLSAAIALGAALAIGFTLIEPDVRVAALAIGAAVVAVACVGLGLAGVRPPSPRWGRLGDVVELLLILALAPLAVWVSGLLELVRAIRG